MPLSSALGSDGAPQSAQQAFLRLSGCPGVFWLDSSLVRAPDGRYSILGCEPAWRFESVGEDWRCTRRVGGADRGRGDPLRVLDDLLAQGRLIVPEELPELPFYGGAVGWLGYELGQQFVSVTPVRRDETDPPEVAISWYDAALVWDHAKDAAWLVASEGSAGARARARLIELLHRPEAEPQGGVCAGEVRSSLSRAAYISGVDAVRQGIARGEYYQLNLVQRLACPFSGDPAATYLRLRSINPAPFSAYLTAGDVVVLSSSPERFIELTPAGQVTTCPIKGTRGRGRTEAGDEALKAELIASRKETAELLMIVDLMRNDLGRVCLPGTIEVCRLNAVETYATVHHLVGEVRGRLRPGVGIAELLRAVFPGGSITGAPKVSAMRAIARLEPVRRGICMGAIGYFSAHGGADLNIAIRTLVCRGGMANLAVGAGIVWDSEPAAEYDETLVKARALLQALGAPEPTS